MRRWIRNARWWDGLEPTELLIENGRVAARGPSLDPVGAPSENAEGRILLPSFIDSHCHILPTGLDLDKVNLMDCTDRETILDRIRDEVAAKPEGWILAVQYDQNRLDRHLTRHDLDPISADRPILLRHSNGHASIANSAALAAAGVTAETPNPEGGQYGRDPDGSPNGILLEDAHEWVTRHVPNPTREEMVDRLRIAADHLNAFGIVGASDMMTGRFHLLDELSAYEEAAADGKLTTRLYVQWREVFGPRGIGLDAFRERIADLRHTRVAGIKIFADGAIASGTAAIYGEFLTGGSGQLIYSPERLKQMVRTAHDAGFPVAVHAIGDRAVDLTLDAFEATGEPSRHRLEHAMLLSDAQIERIARAGCFVTFQPEFLMRFLPAYRKQLGPERGAKLKRVRSVLDAGIPVALNSDRPIVPGDPWDAIRTACTRPSPLDPAENVTLREAILASTAWSATCQGDDGEATLLPGSRADFQLLEAL